MLFTSSRVFLKAGVGGWEARGRVSGAGELLRDRLTTSLGKTVRRCSIYIRDR